MVKVSSLFPNNRKRSCRCSESMSSNNADLPDELLVDIFKRVSLVKHLCLLRCVCKSWNLVISSPSFIIAHHHHHHHHSSSIPAAQKSYLVFKREFDQFKLYASYQPHQDQITPAPSLQRLTFDSLPFEDFPFRTTHHHHSPPNPLFFIGVICGVVCLTSSVEEPSSPTILWNPTIHKYVVIPDSPFELGRCHDSKCYALSLSFGFDGREDDFMVVRLWMPIQGRHRGACNRPPLLYEVFSPRKGIWRKAVATSIVPPGKVISERSFFMNGTIHWIVSANKVRTQKQRQELRPPTEYYRLLMFDCEREEFTTMVLPRTFNRFREEIIRTVLLKCRGMLSIVMFTSGDINLWTMKEYGVAGTWKQRWSLEVSHLDYFGLVSEESLFLMDARKDAISYAKKHHNTDGEVCYEVAGKTYEHILI